jgi:hypothetical protein
MDIGHMTHFIQEMLPAVTKMTNSPLRNSHELAVEAMGHINTNIIIVIVELKISNNGPF